MADDAALRSLSLWFEGLDGPLAARAPLQGVLPAAARQIPDVEAHRERVPLRQDLVRLIVQEPELDRKSTRLNSSHT